MFDISFFLTVIFVGGGAVLAVWALYKNYVNTKAYNAAFDQWIQDSGFTISEDPHSTADSSFPEGKINKGFNGQLKESKNEFGLYLQSEERGSGKNRTVYKRTIIKISVPDTRFQFIVNSKINGDAASGGNLEAFSKDQHYTLEGDFGDFFDIYMPKETQSETLTFLAPNSMVYIMVNLVDFDIEINGSNMYIYAYKHLKYTEYEELFKKIDGLLHELRLRRDDTRQSRADGLHVARTAVGSGSQRRSLKKEFQFMSLFFVGLGITMGMVRNIWVQFVCLAIIFTMLIKAIIDGKREDRLKRKYKAVISQGASYE